MERVDGGYVTSLIILVVSLLANTLQALCLGLFFPTTLKTEFRRWHISICTLIFSASFSNGLGKAVVPRTRCRVDRRWLVGARFPIFLLTSPGLWGLGTCQSPTSASQGRDLQDCFHAGPNSGLQVPYFHYSFVTAYI